MQLDLELGAIRTHTHSQLTHHHHQMAKILVVFFSVISIFVCTNTCNWGQFEIVGNDGRDTVYFFFFVVYCKALMMTIMMMIAIVVNEGN